MKEKRIEQLEKYLLQTPHDPISIYALALEIKDLDPPRAEGLFTELLENHPDYPATYYHAAAFFQEHGKREEAEQIYEKGLALLAHSKDTKALSELRNAYQNFQFEE